MELHILLAAVATGTSLHTIAEPGSVLMKLWRLDKALKTGEIQPLPMKGIDTRLKAYGVGIFSIVATSAIAYFFINLADPTSDTATKYSIVALLASELILLSRLDRYHVDIEKMTKEQGRKSSKATKPSNKHKKRV